MSMRLQCCDQYEHYGMSRKSCGYAVIVSRRIWNSRSVYGAVRVIDSQSLVALSFKEIDYCTCIFFSFVFKKV